MNNHNAKQWRSLNAKKVTQIRGRLLDQAVILFNCVPFQNGNFSEGANSFLYEQFFILWKLTFTTLVDYLERYYFITHVRNCVMGATPMQSLNIKE